MEVEERATLKKVPALRQCALRTTRKRRKTGREKRELESEEQMALSECPVLCV